jgi:hypothetical protein
LTVSSADFSSGGTLHLDIGAYTTRGTDFDWLECGSGALNGGGTGNLVLDVAGLATRSTAVGIVTYGSYTAFADGRVSLINNPKNYTRTLNYGGSALDIEITGTLLIGWVPTPSTGDIAEGNEGGDVTWALGEIYLGATRSTIDNPAEAMVLKNFGSLTMTVKAEVSVSSGWTQGASPGENIFQLNYSTTNAAPFNPLNVGTPTPIKTEFSTDQTLNLDLELKAPPLVSGTGKNPQTITLTLTAEEPP